MKANSFTKLLVQDSSKGDKNVLKLESNTIREISSGYTGTFYLLIYFFYTGMFYFLFFFFVYNDNF